MRNTDPEKMNLSSVDESKGIEPINQAVKLVRLMISIDFLAETGRHPAPDEMPVIYVVQFTYILGGWKAMVSTSEANGHYYELTYNVAKSETYIDRYSKDYNTVVPDSSEEYDLEGIRIPIGKITDVRNIQGGVEISGEIPMEIAKNLGMTEVSGYSVTMPDGKSADIVAESGNPRKRH